MLPKIALNLLLFSFPNKSLASFLAMSAFFTLLITLMASSYFKTKLSFAFLMRDNFSLSYCSRRDSVFE